MEELRIQGEDRARQLEHNMPHHNNRMTDALAHSWKTLLINLRETICSTCFRVDKLRSPHRSNRRLTSSGVISMLTICMSSLSSGSDSHSEEFTVEKGK